MRATQTKPQHNMALNLTAYSSALVPRYGLPAAGELIRCAGARGSAGSEMLK